MINLGNFVKGVTVRVPFNTSAGDGASITIGTNPTIRVYQDGSTTEITAGASLSEDFDTTRTGTHYALIDTSNAAYTMPGEYDVMAEGATIDGITPINAWLGRFSLGRLTETTPVIGLAQAGAAGSVTLPTTAVATDDYYNGSVVTIVAGTGAGQSRYGTDYTAARVLSVDPNWAVNPDNTSVVQVTVVAPAPTTAPQPVNVTQFAGSTFTNTEPAAVPAANASLADKIKWLFLLARNKITQTATTQTVFADDGSTTVATSTVSDNGTTATRGELT